MGLSVFGLEHCPIGAYRKQVGVRKRMGTLPHPRKSLREAGSVRVLFLMPGVVREEMHNEGLSGRASRVGMWHKRCLQVAQGCLRWGEAGAAGYEGL